MRKKHLPLLIVILLDIISVGVILCLFATFHHVIPYLKAKNISSVPLSTPEPVAIQTQVPLQSTEPEQISESDESTEPDVEEEKLTDWQRNFSDHFSSESLKSDNSYISSNVSVVIDTVDGITNHGSVRYHIADIYISDIECFRTQLASENADYFSQKDSEELAKESNAIVAINGDFITYQTSGFMVRNGRTIMNSYTGYDICVLYKDGRMETYSPGQYVAAEIEASEAWQIWNFGPSLLKEDGSVGVTYNISSTVQQINPRSAIGYYEPGHYCFITVEGRGTNNSVGMTLEELAQLFSDLGCTCAYNLDGGGSAVMLFDGTKFSQQSNGGDRELGDILLITDWSTEQ